MLDEHAITATFFIPGHTVDTYPRQCAATCDLARPYRVEHLRHPLSELLHQVEAFPQSVGRVCDAGWAGCRLVHGAMP